MNEDFKSPSKSSGPEPTSTHDRSAGVPPAVAGASRPRFSDITIRDRGRLPHWETDSATYFITFRLADSLPQSILSQIEFEKRNIVATAAQLGRHFSIDERQRFDRLSTARIERYLDSGAGACHMKNPAVATAIAEALQHFDEKRYRLLAWCVMPNHVHVVVRLFPGTLLANLLHSWKSFSAKRAQKLLGITGSFWQREYYDHLLRSEAQFERAVNYVLDNPIRAGLKNWSYVWMRGQDALATAGETPALP